MALQSKGYQDPSYTSRQEINLGAVAAGAAGVTSKFVAHAAMQLFSLTTNIQTLSTSTYSGTKSSQQISVIVIQNTNTTGTAVTLSTSTYGPYLAGGQGLATAAIGGANQFQLNTNTDTSGQGGVPVSAGSIVYCVSGTDATAVTVCTIDYQVQPGAPLTI